MNGLDGKLRGTPFNEPTSGFTFIERMKMLFEVSISETEEGTFFESLSEAVEHAKTLKEESTVWDVSGAIPYKICTVHPE
jgi:hypothetical protein